MAACQEWRCPWGRALPPGGVEFSVGGRLRWNWVQQVGAGQQDVGGIWRYLVWGCREVWNGVTWYVI